jgi:succinylglutamic semialdehyde dehydrogenase
MQLSTPPVPAHGPEEGRGDFIDGVFRRAKGERVLQSRDPARDFAPVFRTVVDVAHVDDAVAAAQRAQPSWQALGVDGRRKYLLALKAAFDENVDVIARAIVREMGKPLREALIEAKSLGDRVTLVLEDGLKRIETLKPAGVAGEARAHPQGVLAVLGPYNFPCHLMNSHIIPALATGNAVVVKPSEIVPMCGELYARCVERAGFPPGVFNLVQGGGDVGRALVAHPDTQGVLFTGSWRTGRAISQAILDQPHKIAALEMGGKNVAVVCDDADLPQALAAVLQGAFLTAGQRCTATSRLLVMEKVAERFLDALVSATRELRPGDPMDLATAFGPLATKEAYEKFSRLRALAPTLGCETLLAGASLPGGAYVTPSIHLLPKKDGHVIEAGGYLDEELFGPDLAVEIVADLDEAIARTNALPFGLSNAIFTVDATKFERYFERTRTGCLNWNRSTNNASGKLPFGGVAKSGNQRPAGIDAVRFTTFPVAILRGDAGEVQLEPPFTPAFRAGEERLKLKFDRLALRHRVEALLERYRIYIDDVRGPDVLVPLEQLTDLTVEDNLLDDEDLLERLAPYARIEEPHLVLSVPDVASEDDAAAEAFIATVHALLEDIARDNPVHLLRLQPRQVRRPPAGKLPRSEAMLRRLYRGDFVPKEKKEPVIDLGWSDGAYMSSIDDDALIVLDAGSQIASLGLGFSAGRFLRALDDGDLGDALVANPDTEAIGADRTVLDDYARLLVKQTWPGIRSVSFTAAGSEANEKAFDLCRLHGPGGRRVIAFDGSFHGRTLVSLHATSNAEKRKPFEFKGYEATFVPFPRWVDPREEPPFSDAWVAAWSTGQTPDDEGDVLLRAEIESLSAVRNEIKKGDICCVIVEPMQGEGGDNYATARFFNGLRALTRGFGVPLVFDEVQVGFGTGGPFWWHALFNLRNARGQQDGPDCITTAKKAQVGACLSVWPDPRPQPAHVAQLLRGRLHAEGILEENAKHLETEVQERLWALAVDYPALVANPRNVGWIFAFDLPSGHLANQLINQRFYRGFMAYTAGEKTVRFRLNAAWTTREIDVLFAGLREALNAIAMKARGVEPAKQREAMETYVAPRWEEGTSTTQGESARQSGGPFAQNYETLSEDPPRLLRWMSHLPRGPLEKVCDRVLAMEGQYDDDKVEEALRRLMGREGAWAYPSKLIEKLRSVSEELDRAEKPLYAYEELTGQLGMEPVRVLAEVLGARVVVLNPQDWDDYADKIVEIENATYEEGRRDSEEDLRRMVQGEGGVGVLLVRYTDVGERVLGYAFGGPVEQYKSDGPRDDVMNGRHNTFYSSNITVSPTARSAGLGRRLKSAQVRRVAELKDKSGHPRYQFMTGRNRLGFTREMAAINRLFGAYVVEHFRGNQYGDLSGQALYYRIPLRRPHAPTALPEQQSWAPYAPASASTIGAASMIDWASSVQSPLGARHPRLVRALLAGEFTRIVGTKLTLSNWATPDIVRYAETLMHVGPRGLPHTYFTSSRAELIDKSIRMLRVKRPQADVVIGLERAYVGHTTAAARSLTDPMGEQLPFGWFDWPRIPHPAEVGTDAALAALVATINRIGPERVLGVFVELVGEKTGYTLPEDFQTALQALHKDTGVPLVAVETASSLGRLRPNLWASDGLPLVPNLLLWYAGAQLGQIFVDDRHYVGKPLTLISTWDGDELSIVRAHHHLLEARHLLREGRGAAFARALDDKQLPGRRHGGGLWQVVDLGDELRADAVRKAAIRRGLRLGKGLPGRVVMAPPLGVDDEQITAGVARLEAAMREVL